MKTLTVMVFSSLLLLARTSAPAFAWTSIGGPGQGDLQFSGLSGICVDSRGRIYVADQGNSRVVRMDDMTGKNWIALGRDGAGRRQFSDPFRITVDSAGRIYVADKNNDRIVRFDDMAGTRWVAFGKRGKGRGQLFGPTGIALDADGRIYIADQNNNRVVRIDDMTGKNWTTFGLSAWVTVSSRVPAGSPLTPTAISTSPTRTTTAWSASTT